MVTKLVFLIAVIISLLSSCMWCTGNKKSQANVVRDRVPFSNIECFACNGQLFIISVQHGTVCIYLSPLQCSYEDRFFTFRNTVVETIPTILPTILPSTKNENQLSRSFREEIGLKRRIKPRNTVILRYFGSF